MTSYEDSPAESAADLLHRAARVRRLMREMDRDADAIARLTELAKDLEARAAAKGPSQV